MSEIDALAERARRELRPGKRLRSLNPKSSEFVALLELGRELLQALTELTERAKAAERERDAMNAENASLNAENRDLLEKWSERGGRPAEITCKECRKWVQEEGYA